MFSNIKIILYTMLVLLPSISISAISVDNVIVNLKELQSEQIVVKTNDEKKEYVAVNIRKIINPGQSNESCLILNKGNYKKFTNICNNANSIKEIGLSLSPLKMIIPKNSSKVVKIYNIEGQTEEEKIYRAEIVPVASPFSIDGEKKVGVKIQIGYEVLIIVPPKNPDYQFTHKIKGKELTITNTGNSNILFFTGKQCKEDVCEKIKPKRIYSNSSHTFLLPFDGKNSDILFEIRKGNKIEEIKL